MRRIAKRVDDAQPCRRFKDAQVLSSPACGGMNAWFRVAGGYRKVRACFGAWGRACTTITANLRVRYNNLYANAI